MFSKLEKRIIEILKKRKNPVSLAQISEIVYGEKFSRNQTVMIATAVRSIPFKCSHLKTDWTLKGSGRGRGGKKVWIEKQS